ncbi:hypothetical protein [Pseudomonas oryzihabitans]|uniref:hypothetical protein n=1 Tax=Pseudomonas oryzihabitans TaxID=47885 RepID=UPI0028A941AE|nr:hypothetical protein [Pseudomonas oryzihabitans]
MHNLKSGDPALVIGYHTAPTLVGRVVTLGERGQCGVPFERPDGLGFVTINRSGYFWSVIWDMGPDGSGGPAWSMVDEKHLMLLKGDFAPERQKCQEVPA